MKSIRHRSTLVYYDGVQVFEGVDAIGGNYIAVLVDSFDAGDCYLVVGVAPERLRKFRIGALDLRSLILDRVEGEWYLATASNLPDEPMTLEAQIQSLEQTTYLPDPGFVLHARPPASKMVNEARSRNNLVMEVVVEPPEASTEHRIRLTTFARLLSEIQLLAKHAYKRALRDMTPALKKAISPDEGPLFDVVVPAGAGSFSVLLEAAQTPDLVGNNELARALSRMDQLFENVQDPRQNLDIVKANKGHFAGAYIRLLRLLVDSDTNLRYAWAEPGSSEPHARSIARVQAAGLIGYFSQVSNLDTEEVELVGSLKKVDMTNGTWKLDTDEGMVVGRRGDGGPSLAGLETDALYRFKCSEMVEVSETGKEERTLYLIEHEPL